MSETPEAARPRRQLHINVNILSSGFLPSAWRWPGSNPRGFIDIGHYLETARIAEAGKLDALFLADQVSVADRIDLRPINALDPIVLLSALATATSRIGLIGTASTTYNAPYNLARRFASLDHVSGGRVAWNIVTSSDAAASRNFGLDGPLAHATRYARAAEFVDVVKALWASWEPDALIADPASGRFADPQKIHAIDHRGRFLSVRGPLNVPRTPQGWPLLVQAGGSDDGRALAARHADAVFSVSQSRDEAIAYKQDLERRARAFGRPPGSIVVLPGLTTIIGGTVEEAERRRQQLLDLLDFDYSVSRLAGVLGVDPARLHLDRELPEDIILPEDGGHTFYRATIAKARQHRYTLRQLIEELAGGTGHRVLVGTPEQIADDIALWFEAGAADGFNLMPDVIPDGLAAFVEGVVPILQKRGLFREDYGETTLRARFGLPQPDSLPVPVAQEPAASVARTGS
ncbi:LLM class flavin-dependent oxidoreductase [Xanthobacter sediminis]